MKTTDKLPIPKSHISEGVYAASLTPLTHDLQCDFKALADHCHDLINRGCQGIVLFGTTGEGPSFSVSERIEALKEVIRLGIDPHRLMMAVSCNSFIDAADLAKASVEAGCCAVLIVPPFFYKNVSDEGVIDFYKDVIQRVNDPRLKILLYHIPQYSGVPITFNVIETLYNEFPNTIVGIKESEGNLGFAKEVMKRFPRFKVFIANETMISEAVQHGAAGGINGITNAYPELIRALYEHGKEVNKPSRQDEIKSTMAILKRYPFIPAIKCVIAEKKGPQWLYVRPPLHTLDEKQRQALLQSIDS